MIKKKIDLEKMHFTGVVLEHKGVDINCYTHPDLDDSVVAEFKFDRNSIPFPDVNLSGEYLCWNKKFPRILGNAITLSETIIILYFAIPKKDFNHDCILVKDIAKYLVSYKDGSDQFKDKWIKWCDKMETDENKVTLVPDEFGEYYITIPEDEPIIPDSESDIYEKESKLQNDLDSIRKNIRKDLRKHASVIASLLNKTSNMNIYKAVFLEELNKEIEKCVNNKK